eukprot:1415743-Prymnesium_polylepis.2
MHMHMHVHVHVMQLCRRRKSAARAIVCVCAAGRMTGHDDTFEQLEEGDGGADLLSLKDLQAQIETDEDIGSLSTAWAARSPFPVLGLLTQTILLACVLVQLPGQGIERPLSYAKRELVRF